MEGRTMSSTGLTIENLSFTAGNRKSGEVPILNGVSLHIEPGKFVTLFGKSGCGKSTLLNIVSGLQESYSGKITFNGQQIAGPSKFIGYIFQEDALFPFRTVLENVEFGMQIRGLGKKERRQQAEDVLRKVGLYEHQDKYPLADKLSGGMKQRIEIACVLSDRNSLILMDEPFSALDDFTREEMHAFLMKVREEFRVTILFVTHSRDEALLLSDRVLLLSKTDAGCPTEIKELPVDLDFPRDATSIRFNHYKKLLNDHLKRS
jgi:NitT/TauT family transport system ATP-binding protein